MMAKAKQADADADRLFGEARGDELPTQLRDRSHRLRRLKQAKQRGWRTRPPLSTPSGSSARQPSTGR